MQSLSLRIQGDVPSPMDRIRATLMGAKAIGTLLEKIEAHENWKGGIFRQACDSYAYMLGYGVINSVYKETSLDDLREKMDFEKRIARNPWWDEMVEVGPWLQV